MTGYISMYISVYILRGSRSEKPFLLDFEALFSELPCAHWIWSEPRVRRDNMKPERHIKTPFGKSQEYNASRRSTSPFGTTLEFPNGVCRAARINLQVRQGRGCYGAAPAAARPLLEFPAKMVITTGGLKSCRCQIPRCFIGEAGPQRGVGHRLL